MFHCFDVKRISNPRAPKITPESRGVSGKQAIAAQSGKNGWNQQLL